MEFVELWLGKWDGGAIASAGYSAPDGTQHLFVASADGLIHPLEIGPPDWFWKWRDPIMQHHDGIVGLVAYYHPGDGHHHVFAALKPGDVWESRFRPGAERQEYWLGKLDGGAVNLAGYSAPDGTQHLFVPSFGGLVYPLEIGPTAWKWRWGEPVMERHDGIVGLTAYYHPGDDRQHVFAVLNPGDVWESRARVTSIIASQEWSPKAFPISYWVGPPNDNAAAGYRRVASAGFTFAGTPPSTDPGLNLHLLDAVGGAELKIFVEDYRIDEIVSRAIATLDEDAKKKMDAIIAEYSGHSALAGYFLRDEPSAGLFPVLAALVAYVRENDPGHACYINLFPSHAGSGNFGVGTYEEYLESYITTVKPFVISYDHYSLLANGTDEPTFYDNLHIVRRKAEEHGLPFWNIILAIRHLGYRGPNAAEKRFEVMQTLAFGAKGVLYFTYGTPYPDWGPGILNADGTPSPQYAEVMAINADVRTIGRYLLPARSTIVFENGALPQGGTRPPPDAPVRFLAPVDVTVGVFGGPPDTYVLLANRDYRNTISTSVVFYAVALLRLDKVSGNWIDVRLPEERVVPVVLAAGDAELYRLMSLGP